MATGCPRITLMLKPIDDCGVMERKNLISLGFNSNRSSNVVGVAH